MPETIKSRRLADPAYHFLIAAITAHFNGIITDNRFCGPLEVEFKCNGVELPFTVVVEDIYNRFDADVQKRALALAEQLVGDAALDKLLQALQDAEHEVTAALNEALERRSACKP
jgi:hypothetical protein